MRWMAIGISGQEAKAKVISNTSYTRDQETECSRLVMRSARFYVCLDLALDRVAMAQTNAKMECLFRAAYLWTEPSL